jgi:hypothetical protein
VVAAGVTVALGIKGVVPHPVTRRAARDTTAQDFRNMNDSDAKEVRYAIVDKPSP